jgi:hypothetical protein
MKDFNVSEFEIAQKLVGLKNKNIIEYDCVNEEVVNGEKFVAVMLEYANAEVLWIFIYFFLFYFFFFSFILVTLILL